MLVSYQKYAWVGRTGKKIPIYNDIACDCGKRRNKREKSVYVIGYRLHTLTAIDAKTGHSFPLVSLLAPANHHDSHFLPFLVNLAQAMGIDVQLITADEAYHDKDGSLFEDTGVILTTPPSSKVSLPKHTDGDTGAVYCHDKCSVPMLHVGIEAQKHEYKCSAASGECKFSSTCSQYRIIPVDGGLFQRIPYHTSLIQQAHDIRKNCERPFNLLKNQTGLETVRVRSQHATMARCTLSSIAVLLIKMAGKRKKISNVQPQQLPMFPEQKAAWLWQHTNITLYWKRIFRYSSYRQRTLNWPAKNRGYLGKVTKPTKLSGKNRTFLNESIEQRQKTDSKTCEMLHHLDRRILFNTFL